MLRSSDRILTTHAGALPRSEPLRALVMARSQSEPHDAAELGRLLRHEVSDTVTKQIAIGLDSVNDGELGKPNFTNYIQERLSGVEARPAKAGDGGSFASLIRREVGRYGG
jgi:5-methyltetrahydropteroyltriglutamate--homocysteine methyltransferase